MLAGSLMYFSNPGAKSVACVLLDSSMVSEGV